MARPKKNKIEGPVEQKEASKIVKNIKKTKSSKILPFAKNRATSIDLADDAAAIVLNADNTVQIYVSNNNQGEEGETTTYAPNEELAIALAALLQNQVFVENTLKTFRELFEAAIAKQNFPESQSID